MIALVNGVRLYYEQVGQGPDVVLVPGLGGRTELWHAQREALSGCMRLALVDPRGHGRSDRPGGRYTIEKLASDLSGVIRQAGAAPAVVVGSSMSSLTAVALAASEPELVRALVLVGGTTGLAPAVREMFVQRAETVARHGPAAVADAVAAAALGTTTHQENPGLVGLYRVVLARNSRRGYAGSCWALIDGDTAPLLPLVRCPVLLVWGAEERVAPLAAQRALRAGLPQAQVRVIPGAGHFPYLEQPARFNAALLEFVAGLPE